MSDTVEIEVLYDLKEFTPGDSLSGQVRWTSVARPVEEVVLRLFWYTSGRGTSDSDIVDERQWRPVAGGSGSEAFTFQLPWMPFSFSGSLVSLTWALEAVLRPAGQSSRYEFVLSPTGREILLEAVEEPSKARQFLRDQRGRER